jgi:hypothetical protein
MDFSTKTSKLVGLMVTDSFTRSQLSSLRAAGLTVRVLAPGKMGGWKPNQEFDPKRVNINCDPSGQVLRVTFG